MTTQREEILIYNGHRLLMGNEPLEIFYMITENRLPFIVNTSRCWRGYVGSWTLNDGKLRLAYLEGYIAKGPLVEELKESSRIRRGIDYEDQSLCSKIALEDVFPGFNTPVFAHWFTGQIQAGPGYGYTGSSIKMVADVRRGIAVNINVVPTGGQS